MIQRQTAENAKLKALDDDHRKVEMHAFRKKLEAMAQSIEELKQEVAQKTDQLKQAEAVILELKAKAEQKEPEPTP